MAQLKVGAWWSKLDTQQQEAFKRIYAKGCWDVNPIRKFLTAAKQEFETIEEYQTFQVKAKGKLYTYSGATGQFYAQS